MRIVCSSTTVPGSNTPWPTKSATKRGAAGDRDGTACPIARCAPAHDADLVGDVERFVLVVRDENRGRLLLLQNVAHFETQLFAHFDVEVGKRLVEEQQLGPRRECARERDALLLAAG